jgi:hypothetical protein
MPKPSEMAEKAAQKTGGERRIISIDLSDYYGEPEGTTVYDYQEMSVPALYRGAEAGPKFREAHPDFPDSLVNEVFNLALTHAGPPLPTGTNKLDFYAGLTRDVELWILLTGRYREKRGEVVANAADEAKKNSSTPTPRPKGRS